MKGRTSRAVLALWMLVCIVVVSVPVGAQDGVGSVHGSDGLTTDQTTTTSSEATPIPPCAEATQSKMTQFSLRNVELHRRCADQSGGVNAFPFDVAPTRTQLVRLSASPACLLLSKAVLRVIEHECVMGEIMPVRATAETILKLNEDRKTPAKYPTPSETELQKQILDRASMNHARDDTPLTFSATQYPEDMQQYEAQLTKAYATGGIVLLSEDLKVQNDISTTDQTGNEAAIAAIAELGGSSSGLSHSSSSGSTIGSHPEDVAESEQASSTEHSGSHGSMRGETTPSPAVESGSLTDSTAKSPSVSQPASSSSSPSPSVALAVAFAFTVGFIR